MKCPNCGCEVHDEVRTTRLGSRVQTLCDIPVVACLGCGVLFTLIEEDENDDK